MRTTAVMKKKFKIAIVRIMGNRGTTKRKVQIMLRFPCIKSTINVMPAMYMGGK